jgi:hypothetical protein
MFKRKEFKFKTYNVGETFDNLMRIRMSPPKAVVSQKPPQTLS